MYRPRRKEVRYPKRRFEWMDPYGEDSRRYRFRCRSCGEHTFLIVPDLDPLRRGGMICWILGRHRCQTSERIVEGVGHVSAEKTREGLRPTR